MGVAVDTFGKFDPSTRKTAIVLSGGGAKGAYQAGFLRAAIERGFSPDIVTGTSVGAINAAAFMQGDLALAEGIYNDLSPETVWGDEAPQNKIVHTIKAGAFLARWIVDQIAKYKLGFESDKSGRLRKYGEDIGNEQKAM